jgi:hypothetical protein
MSCASRLRVLCSDRERRIAQAAQGSGHSHGGVAEVFGRPRLTAAGGVDTQTAPWSACGDGPLVFCDAVPTHGASRVEQRVELSRRLAPRSAADVELVIGLRRSSFRL